MLKEEIEAAKDWLAKNKDKWKNWIGFEFLIPIEDVPPVVLKYVKELEEGEKLWDDIIELEKKGF